MYIGTFYSVCLRIIAEHIEYTQLKKNYRIIDDFDQQYLVFRNLNRFRQLAHYDALPANYGAWNQAAEIPKWANNLEEELIEYEVLLADEDDAVKAIGEASILYSSLLEENNWLDFSKIQYECYRMLSQNPELLEQLQHQIRYLMVDEYQDTNYIQEQIAFLIAEGSGNLCVVGDDDQGLYRFRGATIRNIIQFDIRFGDGDCRIIHLDTNHRSSPEIVRFYGDWMMKTEGRKFKFDWGQYRHEKRLRAVRPAVHDASVVSVIDGSKVNWSESQNELVKGLKESGKIQDYNQVAFLFKSVKHERIKQLAADFAKAGINVYSPRSNVFFEREEVMVALGLMIALFPELLMWWTEASHTSMINTSIT